MHSIRVTRNKLNLRDLLKFNSEPMCHHLTAHHPSESQPTHLGHLAWSNDRIHHSKSYHSIDVVHPLASTSLCSTNHQTRPLRSHRYRSRPRDAQYSTGTNAIGSLPQDYPKQPPLMKLKPQRKIAASFRAGPFQGALLSPEKLPSPPPTSTRINHSSQPTPKSYRPSELTRILRPTPPRSTLHFPHSQTIKSHLQELLYPLEFSEQLACRIVSSKNLIKSQASLDALKQEQDFGFALLGEHNTKLSFMGRRVMHFGLSSFLIEAPTLVPLKNPGNRLSAQVIEEALLTKFVLGQYVGSQWELENIMRWRELEEHDKTTNDQDRGEVVTGTGLWTARGHVVEAILGAVMSQHGTRTSLAVFNSLVLPHLTFRLDPAFNPAIKAIKKHDQELEKFNHLSSNLINWKKINLSKFSD